ncbi:MAG: pyridoxal-dependent decarboxylase [Planctomycetes bacterium]|nr:pyridoxal-dependent decarboxylase [Planctomycetota bacterium]
MHPIRRAAEAVERLHDGIRDLPVVGPAHAADLRQHLASAYRFDAPRDAETVVDDIAAMLRRGSVHVTHPAYFGLFNPSVLPEAAAAAALVAGFNPQTAAWTHCPAAYEMEQHALRFLAARIGFDPATVGAHFCSGGQEANTTAVVVALTRTFPEFRERGARALMADPVLYVSAEAHHSFEKAAHVAGIGRAAVRRVPVDAKLRMDVATLVAMMAADRAAGRRPFFVAGTAGATSSGVIDPLPAIADVCASERLWFHGDAAWGGGALLSSKLRGHLAGIERADSVTWDAHKWLQTPLGGGMFFTPHAAALVDAFATESAYMPAARGGVVDPFNASHQWSRRSAGLPVFAALATQGAAGYERLIDDMTAMGDLLRAKLRAAGFAIVNDTPLPLVNFTHPRFETGEVAMGDVVREVHRGGRCWISPTVLAPTPDGVARRVLRACITSHRTEERDLDALVEAIVAALG